jgi:threonine aldolase
MIIDLRSDTVTKPSKEMFQAMMEAHLGDDVFNEDPTINELEQFAADLFGKEASLFCPSGTMTNQIAINVHTRPGDELIADVNAHIYNYEGGGVSKNSGVQSKLIIGDRGRLTVEQIEASVQADYDWLSRTSLVCLENTVNRAGGSIYELKDMEEIAEFCKQKKLALHLDGARLFNAIVEAGYTTKEIGSTFDSISICLSKGLGAPVGSLLIGSKAFIKQARRARKVFGGGMRQAGILAAAGLYALKNNVLRLKQDHAKAKHLGQCLSEKRWVKQVLPVETNIVIFELQAEVSSVDFENYLNHNGVRVAGFGKQTIRMVTHLDVNEAMIERTSQIIKAWK